MLVVSLAIGAGVALLPGTAGADAAVTIQGAAGCSGTSFCFVPPTATINDGATVMWTNQSGAAHTVTRCDPQNCNGTDGGTGPADAFDMQVASTNGTTVNHAFHGGGTYTYYCKIHGFAVMHGTITVQAATTATSSTTQPAAAATTATTAPPSASPAPAVAGQVNFTG